MKQKIIIKKIACHRACAFVWMSERQAISSTIQRVPTALEFRFVFLFVTHRTHFRNEAFIRHHLFKWLFCRTRNNKNKKTKSKLTNIFLFFLFASSSTSRWFCHFDDDNYVNVPQLVQLLNEYHPTMNWYLGKPSVASPLEIHLDAVRIKSFSWPLQSRQSLNDSFQYICQFAEGIKDQHK